STGAGRSTDWIRFPEQAMGRSGRVRAACYDVDPRPALPVRSPVAVASSRRPTARPGSEPVAGRLRCWRRRPDHLLVDHRARRADRARLRVPLGPRPDRRLVARSSGGGRAGAARRRGGGDAPAADRRGAVSALEVSRALDARPRRRDRWPRHRAGARGHGRTRVPQAGRQGPRPRPAQRLPAGQVRRRHLVHRPGGRRGLAAHRVRPLQRPAERQAELHDPVEPLRAPRVPGAAERPARQRRDEARRRRHADPDDRDRGLRLSVSRRPVLDRGQPHGRPAGALARPLLVLDPERAPVRRQAVLRVARGRHRGDRPDPQVGVLVPRRARERHRVLALPGAAASLTRAMATRRLTRSQQLQQAILYPLDWLEERSGLVGGVRYFLFRKVPGDINWFTTLGSATLTAFLVQALTGVILAMYYKPDPKDAYASIQHITNDVWAGWLVRGMHKWGASVFIILMFLHMGRVFLFGAYKYPRELNWIVGVL